MRRRQFIAMLSGAAAWPLAARAQQSDRVQRIGVLMNVAENDPAGQRRIAAFLQRLQELDWVEGRNLRIDTRWGAGDSDRYRRYAAELVASPQPPSSRSLPPQWRHYYTHPEPSQSFSSASSIRWARG